MGQKEVIDILSKNRTPLTSKEISELIDIGSRSVRRILSDLKKSSCYNIRCRKITEKEAKEKYGLKNIPKHAIKVYFISND